MTNIPAFYDIKNIYNAEVSPSQIHAKNTALSVYFQRYLLQKIFSVYKFDIPEEWDLSYFLYTVFVFGYGAVFNTDKYGTIFQHGRAFGYNLYYRPVKVNVANPLLPNIQTLTIGKDCELVQLTPDLCGVFDVVALYADMMALCMETYGVNILNSKFSFVFGADTKASAETFKKLYDQVASGIPAVIVDKELFDESGKPRWTMFTQDVKNNFIGMDLITCMHAIEDMFDETVGISSANTDKRERLLTSEVAANNQSTQALVDVYLQNLKKSFEKCNSHFNLSLSVEKRYDENEVVEYEGGGEENGID